ncbi:SH3 and multiple ankyrin repeat domains protein 3-like isoform X3 [Bolinopsis microptera]|uniref:SH3 and multiple ankyrin repeat domains protein 3-like isoform X3 n=1 Tax=Bolinopsis microptera TaxID=2820187 RepID=UPI00307A28EB
MQRLQTCNCFKYYSKYDHNPRELSKRMMTKAKDSQHKFFEYVSDGNLEKCLKFLERGLDPNFIHRGSGHTPLTKSVLGKEPKRMIMLLCRYGAFLEFRDKNGYTALHHASVNGMHESMQVLLDVGASVNSRDLKGMTPLYNAICDGNSTLTAEILLKEKCDLNIVDNTGQWHELHQACKRGKTDLVELLLLYGAEINGKTSAGNSALHISASFNKVHCARQLLYRGIDKTIRNKAGQTAYEVAALTSNFVIMDDITNFKPEQAEPFATSPTFTNRKKEPAFPREGSVSSNKSSGSEQPKKAGHSRSLSSGASVTRSSSINSKSKPSKAAPEKPKKAAPEKPKKAPVEKKVIVPVEPTRTNSMGASSSASSTASSLRALPAEFPAPSNTTLQMTLEELIKTARVCKIAKTKRGYGFHVKGLAEKKKEFTPSVEAPCSQFMFGVDKDSESHKAGVLPDDFIYKVNEKDVSVASHKEVVEMIKKSVSPLVLSLIQVTKNLPVAAATTAATAPKPTATTPTAVAPPPAVPRRDPKTRLKGPRLSIATRSNTISGPVARNGNVNNNEEESIYDNIQRPTATLPVSVEPESFRPPPPPAAAPAFVPRTLERMNSAPGGAMRADGYKRNNTLPVKKPSSIQEDQKKEEAVQMVPVIPQNTAAELIEQRKRLTSVQHDNQSLGSMQSTQSEPPKLLVSRSPDNRPVLDEPPITKSKSAEDIARKAAEMRKKRGSILPGEKVHNYELPPPPTVIPPPPPPDDLPPPPPAAEPICPPSPPPPPSEPDPPTEPTPPIEPEPVVVVAPVVVKEPEPVVVVAPVVVKEPEPVVVVAPVVVKEPEPVVVVAPVVVKEPEPVKQQVSEKEPEGDKEDNESYDSGFIQNGKHVEDWEAADVAEWLCGLGLGEYKSIFMENDIKGPNLLDLTKGDLKELGITKLGHRITLTKEINTRLSEGR